MNAGSPAGSSSSSSYALEEEPAALVAAQTTRPTTPVIDTNDGVDPDTAASSSPPPPFRLVPTRLPSTPGPAYKIPKFLRSLYSILATEDPSIVNWVQNQELRPNQVTAFHILQLVRFEREILPKYFKHAKFPSFQRQLNNFGFRKWTKTQSSGVCTFSHNSFPPDPNQTGVLRASIREQWKPKSMEPSTRRRVGNGITVAERKLQEHVQQQQKQQQLNHKQPLESFSTMFKARANGTNTSTKMRTRPVLNTSKSHVWSTRPENVVSPLMHVPYNNNTINLGAYQVPQGTASFECHGTSSYKTTQSMDVSTATSSMVVIGTLPMEPWLWTSPPLSTSGSSSNTGSSGSSPVLSLPPLEMHPLYPSEGWPESSYTGQRHQISPSSIEEFTFDNWMLFVE